MTETSERGVTVVEVALILPTLILMCFGVVDLLRIAHYESMLQRAAADIAVAARTTPDLDYDLRDYTINSGEYYDFAAARKLAIKDGMKFALNSFSSFETPSDAQLLKVKQTDDALGNYTADPNSLISYEEPVAILRPGESAEFSYVDDNGNAVTEVVKHPTLPPLDTGKLPPQTEPVLLDLAPIHIELRARVKPILWMIFGTRTVRGAATTYREKGIRRTPMVDENGNDVAPLTATRKGIGGPEVFTTFPEPQDAPDSPAYGWKEAFRQSTIVSKARCAKPLPSGLFQTIDCPPGL